MSWSHYLLQVNIYLVVFYAFYRLLLAKETYFILNRIYLICSGLISLALPFIQVDWFGKQEISQQIYVQVDQLNQLLVQGKLPLEEAERFNWGSLIVLVYLLGVAFFIIRFAIQLMAVKKMLKGIKSGLAFSFWKKKVVAQNLPGVETVNHHEDIHIKQLHTFDVIFFELLGILTWFNPIIYLYKETVKNIHEYLADEAAAEFQGDKEAYSMLLLNQAFGVNVNSLTNGFFKKSMIKKRIFMLYKERSRKTAIIKYGIVVPLFAAALLLSSATISKNKQILATAEKIKLEDVKEVVAEALELPKEKSVELNLTETKVKFPTPKASKDGGAESFYKFLGNNIKYPSTAADNSIQGNLIANFTVDNKVIKNITIDPKLGYGTDEEVAITLAKYNNGVLSDGKYSMRIEYRLNGVYTPILNENATVKKGHNNLNTVVIMGYAKKAEENDEDKVHSFVSMETPPTYPGGMDKFYAYIGENLKYPEEAKKSEIQGKVFLSFTVEKDGTVNDVKVDRRLGYGTDEEAVRVLKASKKWNPGLLNGKPVRVKYNMPIQFSIRAKSNIEKNETYRMVHTEKISPETFFSQNQGLSDDKSPLVIIDGKTYDGKISDINSKNIASIDILKDIRSTALYGEKGKNGVILITTKKEPRIPTQQPIKN